MDESRSSQRAGPGLGEKLGFPGRAVLAEHDLDQRRGSILVRNGMGARRREVGMDEWGWEQLRPWLAALGALPVGPLFCVIDGPTCGRAWAAAAVRTEFRRVAGRAGVRRRFAPHQLRHALELAGEGECVNCRFVSLAYLWSARIDRTSAPSEIVDVKKLITLLPLIVSRPM
jgi:integrase